MLCRLQQSDRHLALIYALLNHRGMCWSVSAGHGVSRPRAHARSTSTSSAQHDTLLLARVSVTFGTLRVSVTFVRGFVVAQGVVSSGLAVFNAVFPPATAVQNVAKGACANARVHQVCPVPVEGPGRLPLRRL